MGLVEDCFITNPEDCSAGILEAYLPLAELPRMQVRTWLVRHRSRVLVLYLAAMQALEPTSPLLMLVGHSSLLDRLRPFQ